MGLNSGHHHSFSGQSPHFGLPTGPPRQHRIGLSMGSDIIVELVEENHEKSTYSYFMKVALGSFLGLVVLSSSSKGLEMGTPGRLEPVTKPSALKNT